MSESVIPIFLDMYGHTISCTFAGIPIVTLLSVVLATLFPRQLESLVSSGEAIASILLSIFFATVGKLSPCLQTGIDLDWSWHKA